MEGLVDLTQFLGIGLEHLARLAFPPSTPLRDGVPAVQRCSIGRGERREYVGMDAQRVGELRRRPTRAEVDDEGLSHKRNGRPGQDKATSTLRAGATRTLNHGGGRPT